MACHWLPLAYIPIVLPLCFRCASGVRMRAKLNTRTLAALAPRDTAYDCRDTDIKGFLLRVQPSGKRSWFYQYRTAEGRQTRMKLGDHPGLSAEGARTIALERATESAKGIDLVARKRIDSAKAKQEKVRTLRKFLDDRYEPWARDHLKSWAFQLARLRSDFADWLDKPMNEFHPLAIEGLRQKWRKGGLLPRSINRDMQRLQSVLSRAVEMGVLDRHPFAGSVKALKHDRAGRVRFLSPAEETALRKALGEREQRLIAARIRFNTWRVTRGLEALPERSGDLLDHLKPLVLVALNTGLRRGELFSLKWADVNIAAKLLTVVAGSAKSGHTRRIPLNVEALTVLKAWRERHPDAAGLVFPGAEGMRLDNINKSWRGITKDAKLVAFNFHDLRHTFASKLVQAGVDLNTVRELLGHSEISMTLRYSHLAPDGLASAVEKVSG